MNDLINRQDAIDAIKDADVCVCYSENEPVEIEDVIDLAIRATKGSVVASIEQMPPAQPKMGKWRPQVSECYGYWECCECGTASWEWTNYCSNCGAKMEGEDGTVN